jgi:hypothetical protein
LGLGAANTGARQCLRGSNVLKGTCIGHQVGGSYAVCLSGLHDTTEVTGFPQGPAKGWPDNQTKKLIIFALLGET